MRFETTPLPGLLVVALQPIADARGWFARSFCEAEFDAAGLAFRMVQANVSVNAAAGTLRGLHYQADPHGEAKLVRCSRGRIWDVAVDLRQGSPTYCRWFGLELAPERPEMLYIPAGFAHGFVTLIPDSEVTYLMGAPYVPESARGVRWDDPAFAIAWPCQPATISPRDAGYPDYRRDG